MSRYEDLSNEIFLLKQSGPEVPFSALIQMQAFRSSVGLKNPSAAKNQERWLSRISINSAINAFSQGLSISKLDQKLNANQHKDIASICNVLLEASVEDDKLLEKVLLKLCSSITPSPNKIFHKVLQKYEEGTLELEQSTIYQMLVHSQELMHLCCNRLVQSSDEQLREHWLVKISANSPSIYQLLCEKLIKDHKLFIAKFVQSTSSHCTIFQLYPFNEQPCVLLCQIPMNDCSVENLHIQKLMKELLVLWDDNPESVVKLILHFPFITKWLIAYCNKDICAQRLSLRLFNYVK